MPNQQDKTKYITLKSDTGFKYVFKIKENLKELLEDILDIKINDIKYLDKELVRKSKVQKESRLDLLVKINKNIIVNIEMQREKKGDINKRMIFYLSKLIVDNIKIQERYEKIEKHIMISIINYEDKEEKMQSKYELTNGKDKISIIEYDKINLKNKNINNQKLKPWLKIFNEEGKINMKKYESAEEKIKRVAKLIEKLNADPEALELYEVEEKRIRDEVWVKENSYRQGIEQGINSTKKESAIKLLKNGISKQIICNSLDISLSELNSLIN